MTNGSPSEAGADHYGPGRQRYNDDLLIAQATQERARKEFPTFFHVLDHESLRQVFKQNDDQANRSKRQSHVAGFWAVVAAFTALTGAALEPFWAVLEPPLPKMIAIFSAAVGLMAFIIAAVVLMYGRRKADWLHIRLYTERIRQFHFQAFVWRLPDIAASLGSEEARATYRSKREEWFKRFQSDFETKGSQQLAAILQPSAVSPTWINPKQEIGDEPTVPAGVDLTELFRAYDELRFAEQEGYATYTLRKLNRPDPEQSRARRSIWRWYPGIDLPIRAKLTILRNLFVVACGLLVLLHVCVLMGHIVGSPLLEGAVPHSIIIIAALVGIAVKTLSDGFALSREIERYEEYLAVVSSLRRVFREPVDKHKKIRIMMEMEQAAFEEMRTFIRSHHELTFLM